MDTTMASSKYSMEAFLSILLEIPSGVLLGIASGITQWIPLKIPPGNSPAIPLGILPWIFQQFYLGFQQVLH